jgi:HK97 family phage major capsid protein
MFVASADGISTGRDVVTGSNTDFTADGLIDGKAALKTKYWKTARWLLSRTGFAKIRKLKTSGSGEYVWRAGIAGFAEDMILDCPYDISEYVPSTFTVNQYVAVLGDLRFYHILDSLDLEIQRLVELYAATNQVGYIGRYEGDGMPVLEEAFVRMKCGT